MSRSSVDYQQSGSCIKNMKSAFVIGSCVGLAGGFLLGGFTAIKYGAKGRELYTIFGKVILQCGGGVGALAAMGVGLQTCLDYPDAALLNNREPSGRS